MSTGWPLTGRAETLQELVAVLSDGGATGVLLAGRAGVGKTRLAREALAAAARRGAPTRWRVATASARALPLGVFSDLVSMPAGGVPDPGTLHQVATALATHDSAGQVVIGIDDAHLLDDLSAAVVHRLAVEGAGRLVVTVRSGEPAPDAVTALWKDGHLRRVEVPPLGQADSRALVEAVLGGPVESVSARALHGAAAGNVLYLRQLVDGGLRSGALRSVEGMWQWRPGTRVTPELRALIDTRLEAMTDAVRGVVELLAFGEPLGLALLESLVDTAAIEEAEDSGLVTVEPDGRRLDVRLAHPLYGEVVQARVGALAARRLRGRLSQALQGTGSRRAGDVLRQAVLSLDSDLPADPDLLTRGGSLAAAHLDIALSERLARAALDAGAGFDAAERLAMALTWQERPDEGVEVFATLPALADNDEQRLRAASGHAGTLFFTAGQPAEAERVLRAALATIEDPDYRDELAALGGSFAFFLSRPAETADIALRVLDTPSATPRGQLWAAASGACALAVLGRADEMADLVRRGHCAADHAGDLAPLRFGMMWGQVMALCLAGQVDEADEVADLTEAHAGDAVWAAGYPRLAHGLMASARGRVGSAARSLREAVVGFAGVDLSHWTLATCIALARALAIGGTLPEARQALGEATARLRPSTVVLEPELRLTEAWVAAADGAINEARQATQRAAALAAESGQLTLEARALHTAVRFGDRKAAARLAELATLVDGPFAAVAADHARALAADDGGALDAVAARFEGLGLVLDAADAAAQATLAHRSHGALGAERSSAARATALAEQCEGARTPALLAATQPLPLTEREREIATLVARGLSNRAIAERLVVSVRTIEGHVYRACAKLGVTDRAGLGDLLRASGAVPPPENP